MGLCQIGTIICMNVNMYVSNSCIVDDLINGARTCGFSVMGACRLCVAGAVFCKYRSICALRICM